MRKALAVLQKHVGRRQEINKNCNSNNWWSQECSNQKIDDILAFVVFSVVSKCNENAVSDHLQIKQWDDWNNHNASQDAIKDDHDHILQLEKEITGSSTSQHCNWWDEWQHQNVDWEESDGNCTQEFVISNAVLQSDDIKSSVCLKILPNLFVFVDEHGGKEGHEEHFENVHEYCDIGLTDWLREIFKFLISVQRIEEIQYDLEI